MFGKDLSDLSTRMQKFLLPAEDEQKLLHSALVGRLASNGLDGFPYVVPLNFVWHKNMICIHGAAHGMKLENIRRDPRVCFEIDAMDSLLLADMPCKVGTRYQSVILFRNAEEVKGVEDKREMLTAFVAKYTPHLDSALMPEEAISNIAVVSIHVTSYTGKFCNR